MWQKTCNKARWSGFTRDPLPGNLKKHRCSFWYYQMHPSDYCKKFSRRLRGSWSICCEGWRFNRARNNARATNTIGRRLTLARDGCYMTGSRFKEDNPSGTTWEKAYKLTITRAQLIMRILKTISLSKPTLFNQTRLTSRQIVGLVFLLLSPSLDFMLGTSDIHK